ncbi:hypothetical protein MNBD_GAMMA06-1675 [hydrothermal vent metagenome]|uniref:DUF3108 domain-containing protein n=1 Tax=hydrothermal vent metagenome TaxID=652676 RepID=A0A3B0X1U1_9ZZZZ
MMTTRTNRPFFLLLLFLISTTFFSGFLSDFLSGDAHADTHALPEFTAKYAIQKFGIKLAETHYQLSYTNTGYKFSQNTKLHGVARMLRRDTVSAVSYIDKISGNLLLTKHNYKQTGREKNKDEDFDISWNTRKNILHGKITGIVRNKNISLRTNSEIWEALSFQIPLMIEANETIKEYTYKAILKGEINNYNFVLTDSKKITFADKEYKALQLIRKDPERDRQLHIWLIPALYNIPVIIENYRDGKEHSRAQLESVNFNHEKLYDDTDNDDDF